MNNDPSIYIDKYVFEQTIAKLIETTSLPTVIVESVLKDMYLNVKNISKQTLQKELSRINEGACNAD